MGIQAASFAYVGVEIMAASVVEVRRRHHHDADTGDTLLQGRLVSRTIKLCAIWTPLAVWAAYCIASMLVSLDVDRCNDSLSPPTWFRPPADSTDCKDRVKRSGTVGMDETTINGTPIDSVSQSVFVLIVKDMDIMDHVVNAAIAFGAMTCASTNLYVGSRSLFALTRDIDGGREQKNLFLRFAASFGVTNKNRVPVRAMAATALAFSWVPFVKTSGTESAETVSESSYPPPHE